MSFISPSWQGIFNFTTIKKYLSKYVQDKRCYSLILFPLYCSVLWMMQFHNSSVGDFSSKNLIKRISTCIQHCRFGGSDGRLQTRRKLSSGHTNLLSYLKKNMINKKFRKSQRFQITNPLSPLFIYLAYFTGIHTRGLRGREEEIAEICEEYGDVIISF